MQTQHVKYDLMDYITNRLNAQERKIVEQHLQKCSKCNNQYIELLAANIILKRSHNTAPSPVYYSTILPRVRDCLAADNRPIWDFGNGITKIILPLAVSILFVVFLVRIPSDSFSDSAGTEALHQAVKDLNEDEIVQAVEREYEGLSLSPNQEVAAAGVEEHLQGDSFLKAAVSKQIEDEEVSDIDIEGIISDLDREQVGQVLSGLSERNVL